MQWCSNGVCRQWCSDAVMKWCSDAVTRSLIRATVMWCLGSDTVISRVGSDVVMCGAWSAAVMRCVGSAAVMKYEAVIFYWKIKLMEYNWLVSMVQKWHNKLTLTCVRLAVARCKVAKLKKWCERNASLLRVLYLLCTYFGYLVCMFQSLQKQQHVLLLSHCNGNGHDWLEKPGRILTCFCRLV